MLAALWLASGLSLGQPGLPTPSAPAAQTASEHLPRLTFAEERADSVRRATLQPPLESQLHTEQAPSLTLFSPAGPTPPGAETPPVAEMPPVPESSPGAAATVTSGEPERPSIFSRPMASDRASLGWIIGTGPGRFNIIDWESQPNRDRLWWLGRTSEQVTIDANIGFNIHWWAGPVGETSEPVPHLWPRVYDLFLDATWAQRWNDRLVTEVRARPGLYGDFRVTPPDAFRVPGYAVAVWEVTPVLHLVGGIEHLQRNDVQVLPIAGVLWQPTPGSELRLVFPEPKIAFELAPHHRVWGYVAAEYGGGRWTTKDWSGKSERVEYSDYRVCFGLEWRGDHLPEAPILSQSSACFVELGYVFERHLRFTRAAPDFEPDAAWMIRFGWAW